MKIGKAIKVARVHNGWKQTDLAERMHVSATYISLLERDQRDPSWSFVNDLASTLGVPLPVLLLLAGGDSANEDPVAAAVGHELLSLAVSRIDRRAP